MYVLWHNGTDMKMVDAVTGYDSLALDALLEKVYRQGGYDFREYRRGTVTRRLARRLYANGLETYRQYMELMDRNPAEMEELAEEITIKSSCFFRTRYAFSRLAGTVLPQLIAGKTTRGERSLRFWSAACACGEEPYSIAITLSRFLGEQRDRFDTRIYASDISKRALSTAARGIYIPGDLTEVPGDITGSYFNHHDGKYEIAPEIRKMVDFSVFDLTSGSPAPCAAVDCIFCCNVLIYMQKIRQGAVLERLCGLLVTDGYLVLGEVETPPAELGGRLECLDIKARIYRKKQE